MISGVPPVVVGLGQCCWDILGQLDDWPQQDQKAEIFDPLEQGGGPVATALVTLARLGSSTAICGRVGDDRYGLAIRAGLDAEGVDTSGLLTDAGRSSQFAFIAVDRQTASRTIFWNRGSARSLTVDEFDPGVLRRCRVLHLDGLHLEAAVAAARLARQAGVTTVLDGGTYRPGLEALLPLIDHLVVSERFVLGLCGEVSPRKALQRLLEYGGDCAVVTYGHCGSYGCRQGGEMTHVPAFNVDAVDTTGCGDVFHGGYIHGLLQGWDLQKILYFASACAALKTRVPGGRTAIPFLPELESFLAAAALRGQTPTF